MTQVVLEGRDLGRVYRTPAGDVVGCEGVSLTVGAGELVVVMGASGAGKSTLLSMLSTLDRPTSGHVLVGGQDVAALDERRLAEMRRRDVGIVFQDFALLDDLTARENVELPLRLLEVDPAERDRRVAEVLAQVSLADHAAQRPEELSGGQRQRVGIARALVAGPSLLIADEPTAQLDSGNAALVLGLIHDAVRSRSLAAVVATHDPAFAERADRVIVLRDGRVGPTP
jgi:putative ABC transport system ATP-binding protein